jgi:hypothetical protein
VGYVCGYLANGLGLVHSKGFPAPGIWSMLIFCTFIQKLHINKLKVTLLRQ